MQKTIKRFFWLAVGCISLSAAALLSIPAVIPTLRQTGIWVVLLGGLFWLSVLCCYGFTIAAAVLRRKLNRSKVSKGSRLPGLFRIRTNRPASYIDVIFAVSIVFLLVVMLTNLRTTYFFFLSVALFWLSLHLHALFNGHIYNEFVAKKTKPRRRRETNDN